jgi:hypothetical protein
MLPTRISSFCCEPRYDVCPRLSVFLAAEIVWIQSESIERDLDWTTARMRGVRCRHPADSIRLGCGEVGRLRGILVEAIELG